MNEEKKDFMIFLGKVFICVSILNTALMVFKAFIGIPTEGPLDLFLLNILYTAIVVVIARCIYSVKK